MCQGNPLEAFISIVDLQRHRKNSLMVPGENCITILLVMNGRVSVFSRDQLIQSQPMLISAGMVYTTRHLLRSRIDVGDRATGYMLQLEESMLCLRGPGCGTDESYRAAVYRLLEHPALLSVATHEMIRMKFICGMFADGVARDKRTGLAIAACITDLLMLLLIRNAETMEIIDRPVSLLIHKFNRLLEEQYKNEKKVSGYARKLFVTAGYLNAIVKRDTGHSVGYHIRKRIATEALRQARHKDSSLKEVADILGFSDPAHFSKFFKKVTGFTFSSFRRHNRNASKAA